MTDITVRSAITRLRFTVAQEIEQARHELTAHCRAGDALFSALEDRLEALVAVDADLDIAEHAAKTAEARGRDADVLVRGGQGAE